MAADVAVVPGAIQSVPAARVHSPLLVPGPGPARVHVHHLTPLTRGTVEADLGLGLSVEAEGVTVGMTSEIAGPGHQRSVSTRSDDIVVYVRSTGIGYTCLKKLLRKIHMLSHLK